MTQDFVVVPSIRAGWQPLKTDKLYNYQGKILFQRDWQAECHAQFVNSGKSNFILNAPTASGKTNEICWFVRETLVANPEIKAIIVVPSLVIGDGFTEAKELACFDDSNVHLWKPDKNLCLGSSERSNVKAILDFMERPISRHDTNYNVLVCTQVSLVNAYSEYNKNPEAYPKSFRNIFVVIDEAHHVEYNENNLGRFTKYASENPELNISSMYVTATMFRSERGTIIPDKHLDTFERYNLPYDRYLKTCQYLRSISYDFLLCKKTYQKALWSCFKDGVNKTFVFVPSPLGGFTLGTKKADTHAVLCAIAQSNKPVIKHEDGVVLVKRGDKWIRVLDLVDQEEQPTRKLLLKKANADRNYIDVVIALRMLVEGADWRWGQEEIIIGPKNSAVTLLQMVGRVLRDVPGKPHAFIKHIIPFGQGQVSNDQCEDYLKGLMLTMMMEDAFIMPRLRPGRPNETLIDILDGNVVKAEDIMGTLISEWAVQCEKNPENENDENLFKQMAQSVLGDESENFDIERVAEKVWDMLFVKVKKERKLNTDAKTTPTVKLELSYIDVTNIESNPYLENDERILDGFRGLNGGNLISHLDYFKMIYNKQRGLQYNLTRLEEIIKRYEGKIPSCTSDNSQERIDSNWRFSRMKGRRNGAKNFWDDILLEKANSLGFPKFFENQEKGLDMHISRLRDIYNKYDGKIPSSTSKNGQERNDAQWRNQRMKGRKGTSRDFWNDALLLEAKKLGITNFFESAFSNLEIKQLQKAKEYHRFFQKNKEIFKEINGKTNPMYSWMCGMTMRFKSPNRSYQRSKLYPTTEIFLVKHGYLK